MGEGSSDMQTVAELASLVHQAQDGSLDAYDDLVQRFQGMAVGYAHAQLGDFHHATKPMGFLQSLVAVDDGDEKVGIGVLVDLFQEGG